MLWSACRDVRQGNTRRNHHKRLPRNLNGFHQYKVLASSRRWQKGNPWCFVRGSHRWFARSILARIPVDRDGSGQQWCNRWLPSSGNSSDSSRIGLPCFEDRLRNKGLPGIFCSDRSGEGRWSKSTFVCCPWSWSNEIQPYPWLIDPKSLCSRMIIRCLFRFSGQLCRFLPVDS